MQILIMKTGTTIKTLLQEGSDFEHWFQRGMGLENEEVSVCSLHEGESLPPVENFSGIVITGSPAYVTDLAPWNFVGADYLRKAHDRRIPILGICYGHQLLAWAFGGKVGFHPRGREIGTVEVKLTSEAPRDPLFRGLPMQFQAQASHLQSVLELPPEAVLLASNDFDVNHGFRLGESTWCLQFHPEFDAAIIGAYIRERSEEIRSEGLDPDALIDGIVETPISRSLLERFVHLARDHAPSA